MASMQTAILDALTNGLPHGIEARCQAQFANRGRIYYQRGFQTVLQLAYDFQRSNFTTQLLDVPRDLLPADSAKGYHNGSKPDHGDWMGWYEQYDDGAAIERILAAVKHLLAGSARSENDSHGGVITANGAAWEWIYEMIRYLTERGACVLLNDVDTVQLLRIEGDVHEAGSVLVYRPWNEDAKDYVGKAIKKPLFHDSGEIAITKVHVL